MHNRKRDTKTETTQNDMILSVVIVCLLLIIVAGCIAVTAYLNSMKQRKSPTSNNTVEYFPTETAFAEMETVQQTNIATEAPHSMVVNEPEPSATNMEIFETAVIENLGQNETVPEIPQEETLPEIIQEDEMIVIPDYTNQDSNRTEIKLQSAGLRVDRKYEYSDTVPTDAVIRTEPSAGQKTEQGSKICVVVSQGSELISAEMPDLVGQEIKEGKEKIQPYGVHVQVTEVCSAEIAGTILSQSVQAGEALEQGGSVELTVSNGEEQLGTVTYTFEIPSEETSHFVLDFFDEESNHIASSGSLSSSYDNSITVTLEGTGTQKVYVVLENLDTGLSAEVGSYNFYYDDGTCAAITENPLLALQEVSRKVETTADTTEDPTEVTETASTVQTEE